jgi:hypothetical protein
MIDPYLLEKFSKQIVDDRLHDAEQERVVAQRQAHLLFDRALRRAQRGAFLSALLSRFRKPSPAAPCWRDLELSARLLDRRYRGREEVALSTIVGSVGRSPDFDANFQPRAGCVRDRWEAVAAAMLAGETLPAVQLYKVGESYFVLDGNHRVSAAKLLGMHYIDAEVVEFGSDCEFDSQIDNLEDAA